MLRENGGGFKKNGHANSGTVVRRNYLRKTGKNDWCKKLGSGKRKKTPRSWLEKSSNKIRRDVKKKWRVI